MRGGLFVSVLISILLSALIFGYIFAGKIWEEARMEAITRITVSFAFLMIFLVMILVGATDYTAIVKETYSGVSHTAYEWVVLECIALLEEVFLHVILVLVLGFIGLYIASMLRKPKKS